MPRISSLFLAGLVVLAACSDDSTGPGDGPSGSSYDLTVDGALDADLDGTATFAVVTDDGITSFGIALTQANATNAVLLERVDAGRPGTGTFVVGDMNDENGMDADKFYAAFLAGPSANPTDMFLSLDGTVTITKSTTDELKGTIDMTLVNVAGDEEITIEGSFDARGGTVTDLSITRLSARAGR